jgi:two-component system sensor histidine kinase AlgZ
MLTEFNKKITVKETDDNLFLPNFCDVYTLFFCVILTELLAFILILTPLGKVAFDWQYVTAYLLSDLAMISLFIQWINLSSLGLLCLMCHGLRPLENNLTAGLLSYFIILIVTAIISELAWWLDESILSSTLIPSSTYPTFILTNFLLVAILGGSLLYLYQHISSKRNDTLLLFYLSLLLVTFLLNEIVAFFSTPILQRELALQHQLFLLRNLAMSAIISAIVLRYLYIQFQWKKEIQLTAYAHWQALQARIHPHFLFNSLNTIASLTRLNPVKAEQAVEDLAALFRASLSDAQQTTLQDELKLCQQYLRFESLRLGERLNIVWNTENLPMKVAFPPLMLQPLLENALHHGIYPRPEGGTIRITGLTDGKQIKLEVESPLVEYPVSHQGLHIAQHNIQQRLHTYFGEQAKLTIQIQPETYCVTLHFPCKI